MPGAAVDLQRGSPVRAIRADLEGQGIGAGKADFRPPRMVGLKKQAGGVAGRLFVDLQTMVVAFVVEENCIGADDQSVSRVSGGIDAKPGG